MRFNREKSWGLFVPSLRLCLRYPRRQLQAFDQAQAAQTRVPYKLWSKLTVIAVGGSLLYGASFIVMVTALVIQLRALGVPARKTLFSWMAVLNGSGALLFTLFRRFLQGGH
jgi:hypothetical protein